MAENSKPVPELGFPIQIIKKDHKQTIEVLEDRDKDSTNALGKLRVVEHSKLLVPLFGGYKDTPDIGSNGTKDSNKAEKIEASSKGKGIAAGQSSSKEATGDTTEQLKAAQMTPSHPQVAPMSPFDPKDHGEATRRQYHPQAYPMRPYDPKDHGEATRRQYMVRG